MLCKNCTNVSESQITLHTSIKGKAIALFKIEKFCNVDSDASVRNGREYIGEVQDQIQFDSHFSRDFHCRLLIQTERGLSKQLNFEQQKECMQIFAVAWRMEFLMQCLPCFNEACSRTIGCSSLRS